MDCGRRKLCDPHDQTEFPKPQDDLLRQQLSQPFLLYYIKPLFSNSKNTEKCADPKGNSTSSAVPLSLSNGSSKGKSSFWLIEKNTQNKILWFLQPPFVQLATLINYRFCFCFCFPAFSKTQVWGLHGVLAWQGRHKAWEGHGLPKDMASLPFTEGTVGKPIAKYVMSTPSSKATQEEKQT